MFSFYIKKLNLFLFSLFQLLPLAMGKVYPSISRIAQHRIVQHNPDRALEGYISAYSKHDFQIPHPKIYQNLKGAL